MIIGIVGATGSGKSAVGIALAQALSTDIISVDAYQIYQDMDIGTAKVMPHEQGGITHHFIDHVSAQTSYDVTMYQKEARAIIEKLQAAQKTVLLVGGSGYYLKALLHDFKFSKTPLTEAIPEPEVIWRTLSENAPDLLKNVHPNNHKRLINRYQRYVSKEARSPVDEPIYPYTLYGLDVALPELKKRTDIRIDRMIEAGLEEEVQRVMNAGMSPTAAEAIGYKEWKAYFAGILSKAEVIQQIKVHTHQYIKKQRTYFTRQFPVAWMDALNQSPDTLARQIIADINNKASTH